MSPDTHDDFETHRAHLRAVAYRMLGSAAEADDAVQEAWLRFHRAGTDGVDNLGGWLTTVVSRVCLDVLRTRKARREESAEHAPEPVVDAQADRDLRLADSVGLAMLVVLEALEPAERVAFVLHDLFDLPFDQIAPIVGRSPAAARQLASRARRRVRNQEPVDPDVARRRALVEAFFAAARGGDLADLVALLAPDAVMTADAAAVAMGVAPELRGAEAVAKRFAGGAKAARLATIDGAPGAVWLHHGAARSVFWFTIDGGVVTAIELIMEPERLAKLDIEVE